jgi:hypothetical protein
MECLNFRVVAMLLRYETDLHLHCWVILFFFKKVNILTNFENFKGGGHDKEPGQLARQVCFYSFHYFSILYLYIHTMHLDTFTIG